MRTTGQYPEVVGEMLMIGIVLVLAAVFTAQLPNYLPSERSPTVTIMMSNDTLGNVTLWHKGGDWVKINTLKVIVSNKTYQATYTSTGSSPFIFVPDPAEPNSRSSISGGTSQFPGRRLPGMKKLSLPRTVRCSSPGSSAVVDRHEGRCSCTGHRRDADPRGDCHISFDLECRVRPRHETIGRSRAPAERGIGIPAFFSGYRLRSFISPGSYQLQ